VGERPLEELANPDHSPNLGQAPWYFMGVQELLLHFTRWWRRCSSRWRRWRSILPYLDADLDSVGIWFRSVKGALDGRDSGGSV
jgi:hypothetical protein